MEKVITLKPWDEACGKLGNVVEDDPYLILDFGKFQVRFGPQEATAIRDQLNEDLIGEYISLLRTDLTEKPILLLKR